MTTSSTVKSYCYQQILERFRDFLIEKEVGYQQILERFRDFLKEKEVVEFSPQIPVTHSL